MTEMHAETRDEYMNENIGKVILHPDGTAHRITGWKPNGWALDTEPYTLQPDDEIYADFSEATS